MQAWTLRRAMSLFNAVARRPHTPREGALKRMMAALGMDVGSSQALQGESDQDQDDLDALTDEDEAPPFADPGHMGENESEESEEVEEDPCCLAQSVHIMAHRRNPKHNQIINRYCKLDAALGLTKNIAMMCPFPLATLMIAHVHYTQKPKGPAQESLSFRKRSVFPNRLRGILGINDRN